jgi:N-acetylglucosamine kinase-like BadF-type ATPase
MKKSVYFGIDGGGSYSRLALTDKEGNVLASAKAGSTNIYSVSKDEVFANIAALFDSALKSTGLNKEDLAAGCLGSAGLGREEERGLFRNFFDSFLGKEFPVKLCSDGEILLCGGLNELEGYCLIAGTGSIALGRGGDGRLARAGGYGYLLGDEGSASWIGKTALSRIFRSLDGRDLPTRMLDPVLKAANLKKRDDLISYAHLDATKAKVAALAPLVTSAARVGDPLALDILRESAEELALLVKCVIDQSPWIKQRILAAAGGVMENDEIVSKKFKEIMTCDFPDLAVSSPKGSALEGACMIAASIL